MYAAEIATAAIVLGGMAYSSAKARQAKQQAKDQYNAAQVNRMVNVSSTVAPRELVLGRVRKGGAVFYKASTGAVNRTMYLAIALAGTEVDAIEDIYLNDTPVTLNANGEVLDAPYFSGGTSYCKITKHLGAPGQAVDADLLAAFPADWTSANVVEGVAYLVVKLLYSETAYPSGAPNVTAVVRGAKLYDPRTATTVWSENPALMMRHVYQHEKFGKATVSAAEDARFIAVANACDQVVTYTVGGVAQPARPLFTAAIVAPFGTAPRSLLDDLAQSMGGSWAFAGGAIYLKPGVYSAPVLALTDADLAVVQRSGATESQQPISIGVHAERAQKFNTVKATIWDAAQDYKQTVLSDLVGAALVTRDGAALVQEVTFPAVGYAPQALHIAGIMMRDARDALTVDLPVKLRAYPLELFDTISLTLSRYGWSAKTFMVLGRSWTPDGSIRLTLKETAAAITQMDGSFVPQGYAANTHLPVPWDVPLVGPLTISSGDAEALTQADGSIISRLRISWPQVADAAVVSNGQVEVQFRAQGSTGPWTSLVTAGNETTVVTSDVQDGVTYTVRARARTSVAIGQWSSTSSSDVYGKTTAPPAPTATAEGGMFMVVLNWAFGDSTIDLRGTEVWWSATNDRVTAARLSFEPFPGTSYQHIGLSAGQGGYYWLRVANTSSVTSSWYPASATAGLYAVASSDPSALLTQLTQAVGMPQLAAELAAPIAQMPGAENANAVALIQSAISDWDITNRMQFQEAVTNATVTIDPLTGQVQVLATAVVTTDVESRLTAAEVLLDADHGTLTSTVATVATQGGDLVTTQGQVALLADQVAVSASQVYVDESINNATGALTVTAANAAVALAQAEIQSALDAFTQGASINAVMANVATAQEQITAAATALAAEVVSRSALVAVVAGQGAAILDEQTVRATGDSANASAITTVQARLDSGDFAGVKMQSSANADALGNVEARWGVQVQTMADGNRALAGLTLLAGTDGESVVGILADKLIVYKPDGTGVPVQVIILGTVNGASALGFNGNLIVDGSVAARSLSVTELSAITADLGLVTAGRVQNATNTNFVDLDATGTQSFLKVGSKVDVKANGDMTLDGVVLSRNLLLASGTTQVGAQVYSSSGGSGGGTGVLDVVIDTGLAVPSWFNTETGATYLATLSPAGGAGAGVSYVYAGGFPGYPDIDSSAVVMHAWRWSSAATLKLHLVVNVSFPSNGLYITFTGGIGWALYKVT